MHLLLVGPGALGCLLATIITRGIAATGDKLTLLDYNPQRAALLAADGIHYVREDEERTVPIAATSNPTAVAPVDVVVLCVKSYDVAASLTTCAPLLTRRTLVLFLQNGIGHLDVHDHLGEACAAFGTTTEGATLLAPGRVRHAGSGITYLGFLAPCPPHMRELLEKTRAVFSAGALTVHISEAVLDRIWAKLFINVGINALTATLDCKNGELLTLPGAEARMKRAVAEARRVAAAEGIAVADDPFLATRAVCFATAENISSMLQDVRKKRRTEIDAINGAIVARGLTHHIETPENTLLSLQVREIEARYDVAR
jgi:2-dehydropantoate 2-reductase